MQNLKIRVNSADESKEAQELFFKLGFQWRGLKSPFDLFYPTSMDNYYIVLTKGSKEMQIDGAFRDGLRAWKEITLAELRSMVNHDQDEPFLTPECTLNDQYAEIEKVRQATKDNVNHPSHYTQGKVECLDALESATIGKSGIEAVCVANIVKYLWRYEEKNGIEDVKKAQFYLNRLLATLENNNG